MKWFRSIGICEPFPRLVKLADMTTLQLAALAPALYATTWLITKATLWQELATLTNLKRDPLAGDPQDRLKRFTTQATECPICIAYWISALPAAHLATQTSVVTGILVWLAVNGVNTFAHELTP